MSDNSQDSYAIQLTADVSGLRSALASVDQDIDHLGQHYQRVFNQQVASPQAPAATPQEAVARSRRDLTPGQLQEQSPQAAAMLRELTRLQNRSETLAVRAGLPSTTAASGPGASGKPIEITANSSFLDRLGRSLAAGGSSTLMQAMRGSADVLGQANAAIYGPLVRAAIARQLGVSPSTISRDVAALQQQWLDGGSCPVCGHEVHGRLIYEARHPPE